MRAAHACSCAWLASLLPSTSGYWNAMPSVYPTSSKVNPTYIEADNLVEPQYLHCGRKRDRPPYDARYLPAQNFGITARS